MKLPAKPLKGYERSWVKCTRCGNVAYYDYVPFSLSNPIMVAPCGHGIAERFHDVHKKITEAEAIKALYRNSMEMG